MATVKIGLKGLPATGIAAKAQAVHDGLKANPAYPTPTPTLIVFQSAIDALVAANAALDKNRGPAEYQARNMAVELVRTMMKSLAGYVQAASAGNANTILSSAFGIVKRGSAIGELSPPKGLAVRLTSITGRASIKWMADHGADTYHVFMSTKSDPFNWVLVGTTTKSRFELDKLTPRTDYWFAVTAIGAAGETSLSEPLVVMAAA